MMFKTIRTAALCILTVFYGCTQKTSKDFYQWAVTPPMGWNSWDCYGPTVTEEEVKANADYMAEHLKDVGWEYIVVDIRWYVENTKAHGYNQTDPVYNMDGYGRLLPAVNRFPSAAGQNGFKPLARYIHGKGLKFGIHIMRGIPVEAVRKNTPVLDSKVTARDIYSTDNQCSWLRDMYTIVAGREGAQEYYNSVFRLYASWGVDYVKVDDLSSPYHSGEIEMIRKAIDNSGRPIVFSTSPGKTPIEYAEHIKDHANLWRIVGDLWDNWTQVKEHFEVCDRWSPHTGTGHWPDADMLPLGRIGIRAERGNDRMSRLTKDEQITLMTLFAIFRSPLMFGGDLPVNDPFTLSLLTNEEVLEVNQHSINNKQLFRDDDIIAWTAGDPQTGDTYMAIFNAQDQELFIRDKSVWESDLITRQRQSAEADVDITGATKLYLVVSDGGDGYNWDHADWIEPALSGTGGKLRLTDLEWTETSAGWGDVTINRSVQGRPLTVEGKEYANGIGTHSVSVIEYTIPEGYTRLTTIAGLDKECIDQDGATVTFMIFTENAAGPAPADSVKVPVKFEQLGLEGTCTIRDLWNKKDLGEFRDEFAPFVTRHGAKLYRLSQRE